MITRDSWLRFKPENLLDQIRNQNVTLKQVDEAEKKVCNEKRTPISSARAACCNSELGLLGAIRGGVKLKHVEKASKKPGTTPTMSALLARIQERKRECLIKGKKQRQLFQQERRC